MNYSDPALKAWFSMSTAAVNQRGTECNNITLLQFNGCKQVISSNGNSLMMFIFFFCVDFVSEWEKPQSSFLKKVLRERDPHFFKELIWNLTLYFFLVKQNKSLLKLQFIYKRNENNWERVPSCVFSLLK